MTALASGFVAGLSCAHAQAEAEQRIDDAFELVPGNLVELAVPLARRALTRRSVERAIAVAASRVRAASSAIAAHTPPELVRAPAAGAASDNGAAKAPAAAAAYVAEVEEGSTDSDDESVLTRLPRSRPGKLAPSRGINEPLDLVAGAATLQPAAGGEPQQLLVPSEPTVVRALTRSLSQAALLFRSPTEPPAEPRRAAAQPPAAAPQADLLAAENCLAPTDVTETDGDFARNAEALSSPGFCIAEERFKERRRPWTVQTVESGRPGPLWAVMHDDEQVAFDNAVKALVRYGGTLVTLETRGKRNQDGIDPNRNFSAAGTGCAKLGDDAAPKFTAAFRKLYDPAQPVIALHNNFDGRVPTGGLGHVAMNTVPKSMRKKAVDDGPLADGRTLVLLAATDSESPSVARRVAQLSAAGINAVVEPVREGRGDCSLSNDVVLAGHQGYFNVTVDHDGGEKQLRIVEAIMAGVAPVTASR
jgi:hypothetical protein